MDINNKTIVFVCQYAAPYEGNFILSLKALESKLMEQFQAKAIYVFPNNAKTQVWMMSFQKAHKVHFISRRCLKRQPSFFVMQPVYYPFLYLKYLWSSQLLLFEKSSYRNK